MRSAAFLHKALFLLPAFTLAVSAAYTNISGSGFGSVIQKGVHGFDWNDIRYLYAFGDSYTFVQGTEGLANFSFIGDFLDLNFTKQELLSNEIIYKNTSSNGANWPEFLTGCFGGLPSRCAPLQLWDFAFAGADIDGNILPLHHPFTVPLIDQVKQWAQYASKFIPKPVAHTLTAWWIGINDTGDATGNTTITDFAAFWNEEMNSMFAAVENTYQNGLAGAHLFLTVTPKEREPASLGSPHQAAVGQSALDFNAALQAHAAAFAQSHPDTTVLLFDTHGWFDYALDNAAALGFTNTTGFCTCTYPSGFFWYNSGHPTERVHQLLAGDIETFLKRIS